MENKKDKDKDGISAAIAAYESGLHEAANEFRMREDYEVLRAIEALTGRVPAWSEIKERARLHVSTDGNKALFWDGKVVLAITKVRDAGLFVDTTDPDSIFLGNCYVFKGPTWKFGRYYEMEGGAQ